LLDRNEVWSQAHELGLLIASSPEVRRYQEAEAKMKSNPEATRLIAELRELQERIASLYHFGQRDLAKPLEETAETLFQKLDAIPEVVAFKKAQQDVDELLQEVTRRIAAVVSDQIAPPVTQGGG
jgi:cell fate (sporulation/competence/biofilm development) regulator YlbF (YheA/YmcA/DUF963 family)